MRRQAILNVVGLTRSLLGTATPSINAFAEKALSSVIKPAFPAVTCTAQSNYLTGTTPAAHGIVANGWYNRELAEVYFWKQSNHLVHGEKIWDRLKRQIPGFTCAKLFWWYNMYSSADYSITPRPMYPADGRKVFDIYTSPFSIRPEIKADLGDFPFPTFWGPAAGIKTPQGGRDAASRWIAGSAKWVEKKYQPTLSLIYLPHLDYNLQRFGPGAASIQKDLGEIDDIVGDLIQFFRQREIDVTILSEYGITEVSQPVHLNRLFRQKGWITIKEELGLELLDPGASAVFAVADHQVAHVYVQKPELLKPVSELLRSTPGVFDVLDAEAQKERGIFHPNAGDLIAVSNENSWFTYYYWVDDQRAPDFARCVDIHRKPGYDPVELFLDPTIRAPKLKIAAKLLKKKLGFRMLMNLIPLDATLVRGSHGCLPRNKKDWPLMLSSVQHLDLAPEINSTDVGGLIERVFF